MFGVFLYFFVFVSVAMFVLSVARLTYSPLCFNLSRRSGTVASTASGCLMDYDEVPAEFIFSVPFLYFFVDYVDNFECCEGLYVAQCARYRVMSSLSVIFLFY